MPLGVLFLLFYGFLELLSWASMLQCIELLGFCRADLADDLLTVSRSSMLGQAMFGTMSVAIMASKLESNLKEALDDLHGEEVTLAKLDKIRSSSLEDSQCQYVLVVDRHYC